MLDWITPALGAAGGIADSIFGGSSAKKAAKKANAFAKKQFEYTKYLNANRIRLTVDDAKAAGIHPLAALGASSVGGFAQPQYSMSDYGGSDFGDSIGEGLRAAGAAYSDSKDREDALNRYHSESARLLQSDKMAAETHALNNELLRAQIADVTSRSQLRAAQAAAVGAAAPTAGAPTVVDPNAGSDFVTPLGSWKLGPWASAQQWEDRYAEPGSWAGAALNTIADWWHNLPNKKIKPTVSKAEPSNWPTWLPRFEWSD